MKKLIAIILAAVMCLSLLPVMAFAADTAVDHVVINQVYGGGGNSGAEYKNDFVELFNPTDEDVDLSQYTLQYASKSGIFGGNIFSFASGATIKAGGFYLIQMAAGSGGTKDLPTPDATGEFSMAGKEFKIALVKNSEAITDKKDTDVVDFVGVGGANEYEGGAAAPTLSNTTAAVRNVEGVDTNDNAADFSAATPNPRNSSSVVCKHTDSSKYTTKLDETNHWSVCECTSIVPGTEEAHKLENGVCTVCGYVAPVAPALGKTYKVGLYQANLGKFLYITGEMSGNYLATTENVTEAADVFVETVGEDGWRYFIMVEGVKNYIEPTETTNSDGTKYYCNPKLAVEPSYVWSWSSEYNTFYTSFTLTNAEAESYYFGTYGSFDTVSGSKLSYASSSFTLHLYPTADHEHTLSGLVNNGEAGHSQSCSICGYVAEAAHTFEGDYENGTNGHYQFCVCGNKGAEEAHADGDDADKLCDKCGADLSCKHEKDWVANKDTTNHWIECPDCGAKDEVETHALTAKKDNTHHWTECECGYATAKVEHTLTAKKDDTHHWTECECGHATDKVEHTLTTKHNDTHHWSECACGYKSAEVAHTLTDNKCSCGYEAEPETSEPVEVPDDVKAILDAAYALEAEAELPYAVELTGKITAINTAWSDQYNNISVTITVPGCEDQPIMCFRLAGEGAKDLTIGDTITVSGTIMNYAGKSVQFKQGCELKSVVKGEEPAPVAPEDPKEIVDAAYELEAGTALPYSATLTGKIVSIDTEWSEQYKNITVTIKVAGCEDKPIMCYRLKGDEAAGLAVGDTITVTGNIKNYNGTVEFDSGCTLDKVVKNNVPATADNTIIAPVALLMALSAAGLAVLTLGKKKFF